MIFWNREDYLKEASKQLDDKEVYLEVPNNSSTLVGTILKSVEKIRRCGDLSQDTLNYFLVKDDRFARLYLLPWTHKGLFDFPGRSVISNCGFLILRLLFTASFPKSKVLRQRHNPLSEKNQSIRSTS